MHLHLLTFVVLFSCLSFNSYGNSSPATSDTTKFYTKQFQSGSLVSEKILFTNTSNRISFTYPDLSRSPGFQSYSGRHQPSTFKINFHDSFLSKPSTMPLLRNEHA